MEREVIRCHSCLLNQFMPKKKHCRKCGTNLAPEHAFISEEAMALPSTVEVSEEPHGRHIRMDLALLVLRARVNLSQRQLAARINKPRTYISKVENRKCVPTLKSVSELAAGLEVSPYQLVEFALVS